MEYLKKSAGGGVFLAFPRPLHSNDLLHLLPQNQLGWELDVRRIPSEVLPTADDATIAIDHEAPTALIRAANALALDARRSLLLSLPESCNLVDSTEYMAGALFHRTARGAAAAVGEGQKDDALIARRVEAAGKLGDSPGMVLLPVLSEALPFTYAESIQTLGVQFDQRPCFAEYIDYVLGRASAKHGATARVARSTWGLEAGGLRMPHVTLPTSIAKYGPVIYGSGVHETALRILETLHANVTARRVTEISRSARMAVLYMAAGVKSTPNQYLCRCVAALGRFLRISRCSLQRRMSGRVRPGGCIYLAPSNSAWGRDRGGVADSRPFRHPGPARGI